MLKQFQTVGRNLFVQGINASHSGNISIRHQGDIYITRSGAMLHEITESDIVKVPLEGDYTGAASREIIVHRALYQGTDARAIVHAHPPFVIILAAVEDRIIPVDSEGSYFLNQVPVFDAEETISSTEVAEKLPGVLRINGRIAVVRTHGSFAIGQNLDEAYLWTSSLEMSCKIAWHTRILNPAVYKRLVYRHQEKNRIKKNEQSY